MLGDGPEPFEMPGFEMKYAPLHAAFRADAVRIETYGTRAGSGTALTRFSERHAELVRENLFRGPHAFETVGVDDLVQLCDQKLVREYGELDHESPDLRLGVRALAEPA